jgi:hypothetical protein
MKHLFGAETCVAEILQESKIFNLLYSIDIKILQNRLLKVCYAPATSDRLPRPLFIYFLLRPLTVLMKKTGQMVCAAKQSILFIFLCSVHIQFL